MALLNEYIIEDGVDMGYAENINLINHARKGNQVISGCQVSEQATPDLTVQVASGTVLVGGAVKSVSGGSVDLTTEYSALSTGQSRYVYIYVDSNGALQKLAGTAATSGQQYPPSFGGLPEDCTILARVLLTQGDAAINNADIKNMRLFAPQGVAVMGIPTPASAPTGNMENWGITVEGPYTTLDFYSLLAFYNKDNNPTKPKAGIYAQLDGSGGTLGHAGTYLYFGVSDNFGAGLTKYVALNPKGTIEHNALAFVGNPSSRIYRNLVSYKYTSANLTGQVKITLPTNVADTGKDRVMMTLKIEGYEYVDGLDSWGIIISLYSFDSTNPFPRFKVDTLYGKPPFDIVKVGNDGSNDFILLGTTSDLWQYPMISVTELHASFEGYANLDAGWTISVVTTEPTTVYASQSIGYHITAYTKGNPHQVFNVPSGFRYEYRFGEVWKVRFDETEQKFVGPIVPDTSDARNLGSSSLYWNNLYANKVRAVVNVARYRTMDSSASYVDYWCKIATISIGAQYVERGFTVMAYGTNGTANDIGMGLYYVRVKQQDPLGNPPHVQIELIDSNGILTEAKIAGVLTQNTGSLTEVQIFIKNPNSYSSLYLNFFSAYDDVTFHDNETPVNTLPAGTVYNGVRTDKYVDNLNVQTAIVTPTKTIGVAELDYLDGLDQSLKTTSNVQFASVKPNGYHAGGTTDPASKAPDGSTYTTSPVTLSGGLNASFALEFSLPQLTGTESLINAVITVRFQVDDGSGTFTTKATMTITSSGYGAWNTANFTVQVGGTANIRWRFEIAESIAEVSTYDIGAFTPNFRILLN